ncbi:hypothetical protein HID58_054064 [Brassica napus]|uniref:Uncharacterized protein n=1 Tax=Brassica napus TaxID=3708 RepID=A0ABQ8AGG7_BRANA|nr:hypothetical protein HID58_054064 [Brassica napus]
MNLAKISVYDNNSQAFFVLLGDAGREWTWKHASELVDNNFEVTSHQLKILSQFIKTHFIPPQKF